MEPRCAAESERAYAAVQRAQIEPLSADMRRMHVTVGKQFVEDLQKVKGLLSHKIPDGNLEKVLHECVLKTIEVCEKRRRGAEKPRAARRVKAKPASARSGRRRIATAVAREVWNRDQGKCQFVGSNGKRCESTHQIEFHHIVGDARGGPATVANLSLRCRAHNQYEGEKEYGRHVMERYRS